MLKDYLLEYKALSGISEEGEFSELTPAAANHLSTIAYAHHGMAKQSGNDADIVRAIRSHTNAANTFAALSKHSRAIGDHESADQHGAMSVDHGEAADSLADFSNPAHMDAFSDTQEAATELVPV